jgi:hypothetical protein
LNKSGQWCAAAKVLQPSWGLGASIDGIHLSHANPPQDNGHFLETPRSNGLDFGREGHMYIPTNNNK